MAFSLVQAGIGDKLTPRNVLVSVIHTDTSDKKHLKAAVMPRHPHADRPRIKAAIRHLWRMSDGNLPSASRIARILSGDQTEQRKNQDLTALLDGVLDKTTSVHRDTVGACIREIEREHGQNKLLIDRTILEQEQEPLISENQIWPDGISGLETDYFSDDRAFLVRLFAVHKAVFNRDMPTLVETMAKRLRGSLDGLDPAVTLFLLMEYPVRASIKRQSNRQPDIFAANRWKPTFKDVDALIALAPWAEGHGIQWDLLAEGGILSNYYPLSRVLEPLCMPEWQSVIESTLR